MFRSLSLGFAAIAVIAPAALSQSGNAFSGRNGQPLAAVQPITVEKPAEMQVRRAEAVTRRVTNAPPAPASSNQPALAGAGAVFRAGDSFQLRMTGMPAEDAMMYALDFTIGGDGFVNIPLAGQVRAAGLTQSQLERAIEKKLIDEKIFRWPTATINVPNAVRFVTVGGNVRAPNRLAWSSDLTLLSAISAQGGPGDFAGDRVMLIRGGVANPYSVKKLKRNPADDPHLLPGDQLDLQ